jgi:hypothetical protein
MEPGMPTRGSLDEDDYEVILVVAPIDRRGNVVDVEADGAALAALHTRVDELDRSRLSRAKKAARRHGLESHSNGADILHDAIERLLKFNRLLAKLCLDGTIYLVTGEAVGELRANDEYGLMAALQESGIVEDPIADEDLGLPIDSSGPGDMRPIAAWIASLILETSSGRRLSQPQRTRLQDWSREGDDPNQVHSLTIPSVIVPGRL